MPKQKIEQEESTIIAPNIDAFFRSLEDEGGIEIIELAKLEDSKPNDSGSLSLNLDLVRALPEGGIIEIFGDEGSGKSSVCLEALGQAIAKGKMALYVDQERALQRSLVQSIRTLKPYVEAIFSKENKSPIRVVRLDSAEKALETVRQFAITFPGSMIVVDSVDALVPESKMVEEIGTQTMGGNAKLMSEALRILAHDVSKAKSTVIFINQKREKVGLVFGDPSVTGGGKGLKFYSWQRIELLKPGNAQRITNTDKDIVGHRARYKIVKNKLAANAGAEGDFPILYGKGIFRELELIEQCSKFGILKRTGKGNCYVVLPLAKNGKLVGGNAVKNLSNFNAGRYLLLDTDTYEYWHQELQKLLEVIKSAPPSKTEDEILNPEGS